MQLAPAVVCARAVAFPPLATGLDTVNGNGLVALVVPEVAAGEVVEVAVVTGVAAALAAAVAGAPTAAVSLMAVTRGVADAFGRDAPDEHPVAANTAVMSAHATVSLGRFARLNMAHIVARPGPR